MNISPEWIVRIILIVVCFGFVVICNLEDEEVLRRKREEIRKTRPESTDTNASEAVASAVAILIVVAIFGYPLFLIGSAFEAGAGPGLLLIGFFVLCGVGGWKSSGADNAVPPPSPKSPEYVDKNWQHSPGGIETQKFEGEYDGQLNKEFEQK